MNRQQLREKKNQIIDSLNPIKIVGAVGSFPQFDKAKADLDHLIDEYVSPLEAELRFYRNLEVEKAGLQPHKVKAEQLYAEVKNNSRRAGIGEK